jgi:Desulfoferrodoxin, N-terminal domain
MRATKPGERFRCAQCGTQVVVVRPGDDVPRCCNAEMESLSSPAAGP